MTSARTTFILIATLLIIAVVGIIAVPHSDAYTQRAEAILAVCEDVSYRPACYDREIPKLMDEGLSMEEAFEVTRIVQQRDSSYRYCHVLGHYLSAKETAKDPSKWKEVVARAPSGICSNGAIHGAFQERFRAESLPDAAIEELKPELEGICEPRAGWNPTPLEQATCTHALGHLTMYVTGANVPKSLALCDTVVMNQREHEMSQLCYDGVFMQIFQPLEPDDFALIEGQEVETQAEAELFCSDFSGPRRGSCISESWPLYRENLREDPVAATTFCEQNESKEEHNRCYQAVFNILTATGGLRVGWASSYCPRMPEERRGQCFASASTRMIEVDWGNIPDAITVCESAGKTEARGACYDKLVQYSDYNFPVQSDAFTELCEALPSPWQTRCFAKRPDDV